jgi:WD40-like Beta Propeller Repeat
MTYVRSAAFAAMGIGSIVALASRTRGPAAEHTRERESQPPYAVRDPLPTPRLFGEGVISTSDDEYGGTFTPDGKTIYFNKSVPYSYRYSICESHWANGHWTTPVVAPFSGKYSDSDPAISADGSELYWTSDRPVDGKIKHDYDIWMVKRVRPGVWSEPIHLPAPVNSDHSEFFASVARNGTLYFSSARDGGDRGAIQAYRTRLVDGKWTTPENISRLFNAPDTTAYYDLDVEIDPDERFLLISSVGRPDGFGHFDLYVTWNDNGKWTKLVHLPAPFNTRARDYSPHISPDGRYLFFSSERGFALDTLPYALNYAEMEKRLRGTLNGGGNLYQIDLSTIEAFRPK